LGERGDLWPVVSKRKASQGWMSIPEKPLPWTLNGSGLVQAREVKVSTRHGDVSCTSPFNERHPESESSDGTDSLDGRDGQTVEVAGRAREGLKSDRAASYIILSRVTHVNLGKGEGPVKNTRERGSMDNWKVDPPTFSTSRTKSCLVETTSLMELDRFEFEQEMNSQYSPAVPDSFERKPDFSKTFHCVRQLTEMPAPYCGERMVFPTTRPLNNRFDMARQPRANTFDSSRARSELHRSGVQVPSPVVEEQNGPEIHGVHRERRSPRISSALPRRHTLMDVSVQSPMGSLLEIRSPEDFSSHNPLDTSSTVPSSGMFGSKDEQENAAWGHSSDLRSHPTRVAKGALLVESVGVTIRKELDRLGDMLPHVRMNDGTSALENLTWWLPGLLSLFKDVVSADRLILFKELMPGRDGPAFLQQRELLGKIKAVSDTLIFLIRIRPSIDKTDYRLRLLDLSFEYITVLTTYLDRRGQAITKSLLLLDDMKAIGIMRNYLKFMMKFERGRLHLILDSADPGTAQILRSHLVRYYPMLQSKKWYRRRMEAYEEAIGKVRAEVRSPPKFWSRRLVGS